MDENSLLATPLNGIAPYIVNMHSLEGDIEHVRLKCVNFGISM